MNRIAGLLHDYQLAADELARAKAAKEAFEGSNDMTAVCAFAEKDTMRSVAEINTDLENLDIEKNQIIERLQECETQRSQLHDQLDNLNDKSDELQEKKEEKARLGKKPFIIMDDPFTNLDEKRLAGGKKVLGQMAEDYQVIYLTCHQSRVPGSSSDLQGQHQAESK